MKLEPIQNEFFIALIREPKGDWFPPDAEISDTADDALASAVNIADDEDDYRILHINMTEGTVRDVSEDACRNCSWHDNQRLPMASEQAEAEDEARLDALLTAEHEDFESALLRK